MKSIRGVFARKKIIFMFLLAIFLPSLFVGYLSFQTLCTKREVVKNALESNLVVSGSAALKSIEDSFFQLEDDILAPERFTFLSQAVQSSGWLSDYFDHVERWGGKYFLLDSRLKIILPKTVEEAESDVFSEDTPSNSSFDQAFRRAEQMEFSQKDYLKAAQLYGQCVSAASSNQEKTRALFTQGRCLISQNKLAEAGKIYQDIYKEFSQVRSQAGHPYGVLAALKLYEIERKRQQEDKGLKILLDAYEKTKKGLWALNLTSYELFVREIESILESRIKEGGSPDSDKSFKKLQKEQDIYFEVLAYADFLRLKVIPELAEKVRLRKQGDDYFRNCFSAVQKDRFCIISFCRLPAFKDQEPYFGGFCWDPNTLKNEKIPTMLSELAGDTGLEFQISDEAVSNSLSKRENWFSRNFISLSFQQIPLPWTIQITQPALSDLERAARRENLLYGILLVFIVGLMILGTILLARDVSRESEVSNLKTEFVKNISHELRTPLTLIRLYGEILQQQSNISEMDKQEAYEIITKESERLSHLINNVLDFSRIETGRKEFDFKEGNLAQVVRETIDSYRYHLEKEGFLVEEKIADDLPRMFFDREALTSVLINLLSNAMKFSQENKVVSVGLSRDNSNAVLQVQDEGIGIPAHEIPKIFSRFYRANDSFVSETRGSGLGLMLAKHIIEAHRGSIRAESEPGKGSLFTIVLPLSGPHEDEGS